MAFVPTINSTSHVPDTQDWIRYYASKDANETVPCERINNIVTKDIGKVDIKQPTTDKLVYVESSEKVQTNKKENIDMADVELVSPVQGAVQQARAEYERADPIKRRTGIRRRTKKTRRRKHTKRRRKKPKKKKKKKQSRKKGKRLKKKVHKKKLTRKRRKKRVPKRDIFTD
jgi:hypothetical protein